MIILCILTLLTALACGLAFLSLRATGHALTRQALLSEQIAELLYETQFQSRVTRKALVSELQKVEGYKQPDPTPLERAWADLQAGREPDIDFAKIGRKPC